MPLPHVKEDPPGTPLDDWTLRRIAGPGDAGKRLTRAELSAWQLQRLRAVVDLARRRSPFYRSRLADPRLPELDSFESFTAYPLTTAHDLRKDPLRFLCTSQSAVERVVTLPTSGTSGDPKRLFFSAADIEGIVDFFHRGLTTFVAPGQRMLIFFPGRLPASVGDLMVQALERIPAQGFFYSPQADPAAAVEDILGLSIDCVAGLPVQVLAAACHPAAAGRIPPGRIRSVLLSADHVPASLAARIAAAWETPVYEHYGMTEMGLGGGVQCAARDGYHLREADLFFEIIDPLSGRPCRQECAGEVVFTTLTREAMPLIRYRTGDLSSFCTGPCRCGSQLRRLARVSGRIADSAGSDRHSRARSNPEGGPDEAALLTISDLDEALFALPEVLDFDAELIRAPVRRLRLRLDTGGCGCAGLAAAAGAAVLQVPAVCEAVSRGSLILDPVRFGRSGRLANGMLKRRIIIAERNREPYGLPH